jgi:hypothetical protein
LKEITVTTIETAAYDRLSQAFREEVGRRLPVTWTGQDCDRLARLAVNVLAGGWDPGRQPSLFHLGDDTATRR